MDNMKKLLLVGEMSNIPECGDDYFSVSHDGEILCFEFTYAMSDVDKVLNRNCFATREEAEQNVRDKDKK